MTTWPDPARPGVPRDPERTGPHWVFDKTIDRVICLVWSPIAAQYYYKVDRLPPEAAAKFYDYVGPCLTPDDAAALTRRAEYAEAALEDARANLAMLEPAAQHADAAVAAAVERAAEMVDCGCPAEMKAAITSAKRNSAERWYACSERNCAAIDAADIRATIPATASAALAEYRKRVLEAAREAARKQAVTLKDCACPSREATCAACEQANLMLAAIRALGEAGDA